MRFTHLVISALQAISFLGATALPTTSEGSGLTSVINEAGTEIPEADTIIQRSAAVDPIEIPEASINELDIVQRDSADPAHELTRRAVNIKLMADTGSRYRISVRGVVIILHIFYDLATERARMYWSPDSSNPAPSSLKFGAYDRTRGVTFQPTDIFHDNFVTLTGFKLYDVVQIFTGN